MSSDARRKLMGRGLRALRVLASTLLAAGIALALTVYLQRPDRLELCEPRGGALPVCGFENPEDLALLPSGWVLVSEFSPAPTPLGALAAYHPAHGRVQLFPASDVEAVADRGAPACPGPPGEALSPHGLGLRAAAQGELALLVVNHGRERETIELFDVEDGAGPRPPSLSWRGCVPLPEGKWANDVTPMPDGALAATNMLPPPGSLAAVRRLLGWTLFGSATGEVNVWSVAEGWSVLAGSELRMPNGILATTDGGALFVSEWGARRVHRIEPDGASHRSVELGFRPDNLSFARDGRVLVTGQGGSFVKVLGCAIDEGGACVIPYQVVALDPESLRAEILIDDPGHASGAASVAIETNEGILVGSFAADRIALHPLVAR